MRKLQLLFCAIVFCIASLAQADHKNILGQGSFELDPQRFWSGTKQLLTIDTTVYKEGAASAKVVTVDIDANGYLYTYCPMKEGKTYKISLWYKIENLIPDSGAIKISLNFNRKDGTNGSAGSKLIPLPSGDTTVDWKSFSAVVTPPEGTDTCQFIIQFGKTKGTIWFDDITVVEEEGKTTRFPIAKTSAPPVIDGKGDDACWRNAIALGDFLIADYVGKPAVKQTAVKVAYDAKNLYIYVQCMEPRTGKLSAKVQKKDGPVWDDDCVEIFISPSHGKTFQFSVNSIGTLYDSEILVNDQTATGYLTNIKWDSSAQVKSFVGNDYWSAELAIPIASLTLNPVENASWKINFAREEKTTGELSSWSRLSDSFYQPKYFSEMTFSSKGAFLTRALKIGVLNPFVVQRQKPLYKELLTNTPAKYTAYMWDGTIWKAGLPKAVQERFNDEQWKNEVLDMLKRKGEARIGGTALPWAVDKLTFDRTEAYCMEDWQKFGTKRKYITESSAAIRIAIENGAEIQNKDPEKKYAAVSLIDPVYVDGVIKGIVQGAEKFKDKPYFWTIEGKDEPNIWPIQGRISEMGPKMKAWNEETLTKYGFGKYAIPAPDDPSYWTHTETHAFQQIAFARWFSDAYANTKKQMYEALKKTAPDAQYVGNTFWFMSGFYPYDYSLFAKYSDMLAGDPYASSAERREGRGIYNHGFGTKFLRDLGGKPTIAIVQAFSYAGYTPRPDDIREWVSQSLKNGASRIEFYENAERYGNPPLYEEMLRLAKIVTTMNLLNVPVDADTAIICSFDSEAALKANGDQIYTAYSLLGEKIGSWFDFVSDRQMERDEKDLSKYKIVYLPLAKYLPKPAVLKVLEYVKKGGTLVLGDPEAFAYHRDGSSLSQYREELTGTRLGKETFNADAVTITSGKTLLGRTFPLMKKDSMYEKIHLAHQVTLVSRDAKVLAKFADGNPAIIENTYGNGKVVYFVANPFAPDVVLIDNAISEFFRMLQEEAKTKTDRPIWKFLLPK